MGALRALRHIAVIGAMLAVTLGIPASQSRKLKTLVTDGPDAIASATVEIDQPSGEYYVLINRDRRTDEESLEFWRTFFSGGSVGFIFEDIVCSVASGDAAGLQLAQSFQSRLPENQMKIKTEDSILLFSKADHEKFDVLIVSAEIAKAYNAYSAFGSDSVEVISLTGET